MDLVEFLHARLSEDEAFGHGPICCCADENRPHDPDCPDRLLREVEAKRRIVEGPNGGTGPESHDEWVETLRLLALPFADHPDYEDSWRP